MHAAEIERALLGLISSKTSFEVNRWKDGGGSAGFFCPGRCRLRLVIRR